MDPRPGVDHGGCQLIRSAPAPLGGDSVADAPVPTLLCVDDEPGILDAYRAYLDPDPRCSPVRSARSARLRVLPTGPTFRVLQAASGPDAVRLAAEETARGNRIQVAFLDMNLPDQMDGLATMEALRSIDPQILCVFATASQDYTLDQIAVRFPVGALDEWDYLNKPFTANEIIQKARNMSASWFRRRTEEELLRELDQANAGLEREVSRRTQELADANLELQRKSDHLERLMRTKDEFLATVSHELRTPLTAVVGLAEELRIGRGAFTECEVDEFVNTIAEQSNDVAHIIEDLLVTARADVGTLTVHPRRVEVRREVDAVLRSGSLHHETDHRLSVSGEGIEAWADPSRVRQILRNLVVNALRYGGEHIAVKVDGDDAVARVAVADTGDAIPEDQAEQIFEPYYRAHSVPTQPGSVGLGLAVSRRLARLMGGDVTYRHDGGWSVFELAVPAAPEG